jgi:hypothetical protein
MTDDSIEAKALALLNEVRVERWPNATASRIDRDAASTHEALCRALEQHEAFKQEVSDVVYKSLTSIAKNCVADAAGDLSSFIIPKPKPKPDPIWSAVEHANNSMFQNRDEYVENLRAALDALGFEIRKKNDG